MRGECSAVLAGRTKLAPDQMHGWALSASSTAAASDAQGEGGGEAGATHGSTRGAVGGSISGSTHGAVGGAFGGRLVDPWGFGLRERAELCGEDVEVGGGVPPEGRAE